MIVSGHQPVYLPWLGLFHKLSLCDTFVYMDTVQYLTKDWNNRNKIRTPHGWMWLTVPVDRKKSSGKMLPEIVIRGHDRPEAKDFWQNEHWRNIECNYAKAPYFDTYAEDLRTFYLDRIWTRLVDVCWAQFELFRGWLSLDDRQVVRMSEFQFEGTKDRLVLSHCLKLGADRLVMGALGRNYADPELFKQHGISVYFQDYDHPAYRQRFPGFESHLSVLDLILNHGPESADILLRGNVTRSDLLAGGLWSGAVGTEGGQ